MHYDLIAPSLDVTDLLRNVVQLFANLDDSSETERRTALISAAVIDSIDLRGWTPSTEEVVV